MKKKINILLTSIFTLLLLLTNIIKVNAATANIQVTSNTNRIVVGNTFTVNVKVSASNTIGSWNWTISYDTKKLKLMSGPSTVAGYGDSKIKSKTYTYKFKAISTGNASITVKSPEVYDYKTEKALSISKGTKSISIITQAQLEASYSKNNNLKSLSVDGLKLSPEFNKNTTEYKVEASSNTEKVKINASKEDSKASIEGTGTHEVTEGENKIKVTVTAENGSTKTYTIVVNVTDPNPINVKINDKEYTVVKRESKLEAPKGYEKTEITIQEQKIPAFYNDTNKYTLIGLKDTDSNIKLYIYENNEYKPYSETLLTQNKIYPLPLDKEINGYTKTTIKINDIDYESYQINEEYYIIHAKDLDTGNDNYFTYDKINNTIIRFFTEEKETNIPNCDSKIKEYQKMLILLFSETIIIFIILIIILISKISKNKKRKKQRELLLKQEELKRKEEEQKQKELEEQKENKKEEKHKKNKKK